MEADTLFTVCSRAVLPAWILLAVAPRWKLTRVLIFSAWIPMLLALAYVSAFIFAWPLPADGSFNNLAGVMRFFQDPYLVVAGWIHYLAFDLFVGCWEVRDAERQRIPHLVVVPCLFLTLMLGPVGLFVYFAIRLIWRQRLSTEENVVL